MAKTKKSSNRPTQLKSLSQKAPRSDAESFYSEFNHLNGSHPWMQQVPEGFLPYNVRLYKKGQVTYFNYALAKEMGLIADNHPHEMNPELEAKLMQTFSLRIINEFDLENDVWYSKEDIKPNSYMATRYLQLQHPDKRGTTSGDGRGIWNGAIKGSDGVTWDVSSRGTGVTALAPGCVEAGEPLKSGNTEVGYGCGLAEVDELYSAAIMAEVVHNRGINTERVLAIIDHGGGFGIGVRAGKNLFRPAHIFMYLKQENHQALARATDFLIDRQFNNGEWKFSSKHPQKYDRLLEQVSGDFAKFAARLEREYLFAWLDWDGDNVLATAGIIDYGSIRQLGLRHDQYRYDDVERWSTNLNEQKGKARLTIQVFAQLVSYLKTKQKTPRSAFKNAPCLKTFDRQLEEEMRLYLLLQIGLSKQKSAELLKHHPVVVNRFFNAYEALERVKTKEKAGKVADGINRPAIYNMRFVLRELSRQICENGQPRPLEVESVFELMLSANATEEDRHLTSYIRNKIQTFQNYYFKLLKLAISPSRIQHGLTQLAQRSGVMNPEAMITGNGLVYVVNEILARRKRGLPSRDLQGIIDELIIDNSPNESPKASEPHPPRSLRLMNRIQEILEEHSEDI